MTDPTPQDRRRPATPRWTHVALPVRDVDASADWYEIYTPLRRLDRRSDPDGDAVWLGDPDGADRPFILVLVSFHQDVASQHATLAPFAHLGIELPTQADVDAVAALGAAAGCLEWPPEQLPDPVGYVCALTDPDGNMVEFSFDQGIYELARERWSSR